MVEAFGYSMICLPNPASTRKLAARKPTSFSRRLSASLLGSSAVGATFKGNVFALPFVLLRPLLFLRPLLLTFVSCMVGVFMYSLVLPLDTQYRGAGWSILHN